MRYVFEMEDNGRCAKLMKKCALAIANGRKSSLFKNPTRYEWLLYHTVLTLNHTLSTHLFIQVRQLQEHLKLSLDVYV